MVGYTTWPWNDDAGALLTIYGKHPDKDHRPKTMALSNAEDENGVVWEKTKKSPYLFDRAIKAGQRDLVLVEGPTDAAVPVERGDPRVIACVGAQFSGDQIQTMKRHGVRSVVIALDPDQGGAGGVLSCVRQLIAAGIRPYVAPTFPDGLDPDEFILREGMDGWKAHIAGAVHGYRHQARVLIDGHGERQPGDDFWVDDVIDKAVGYAKAQPAGSDGDLRLHFFPEVAAAVGATVDDLAARVAGAAVAAGAANNKDAGPTKTDSPDDAIRLIDAATFFATDYRLDWHIEGVLAQGQPCVIGGPKKCLKPLCCATLPFPSVQEPPFWGSSPPPARRESVLERRERPASPESHVAGGMRRKGGGTVRLRRVAVLQAAATEQGGTHRPIG